MDIIERLEKWLEKDQIIARDWGEDEFPIDGDIELAIDEIKRLRHLTSQSVDEKCSKENHGIKILAGYSICPDCGEIISAR